MLQPKSRVAILNQWSNMEIMDSLVTKDPLVNVRDAARRLPVSQSTLYNLAKTGVIPAVRIGTRFFFKPEILDQVLREGTDAFAIKKATPVIPKEVA